MLLRPVAHLRACHENKVATGLWGYAGHSCAGAKRASPSPGRVKRRAASSSSRPCECETREKLTPERIFSGSSCSSWPRQTFPNHFSLPAVIVKRRLNASLPAEIQSTGRLDGVNDYASKKCDVPNISALLNSRLENTRISTD